jgi:hypothetical protein
MAEDKRNAPVGLSALPDDELRSYGEQLGLSLSDRVPRADLLRLIRQRQELLLELDREAMLDIVVWARRPVRQSASKEELAKLIAVIDRMHFDGLSHRGLVALARLRNVDVKDDEPDARIVSKLKKAEDVWHFLARKRRKLVGAVLERAILGKTEDKGEYKFLPEHPVSREPRLRDEVEDQGIVRGLAGQLRHVADDYIEEKLIDIERRIDQKLDEIDARLAEWRDREIANRLKIIKITLAASLVVALLSLGYKYASTRAVPDQRAPASRPALLR